MTVVDRFRSAEGLELVAEIIRDAAAELHADNETAARKELRDRLQVLEGWKASATPGSVEAVFIDDLMWIYRDALAMPV